jgi:hypothetical protein
MNKINAYKEILTVLDKHAGLLEEDYFVNIRHRIANRINLQEISEEFGITLGHDCDPGWCRLSEYEFIGMYGSKYNRTISWSDDATQPENERLYMISFPAGPYIFGGDYPEKTFKAFFDELKSYGPKYSDTHNKNLYFTSAIARNVHENFNDIFKKYKSIADIEVKQKKIKKLKEELASLEGME